jgi:hypothetical protein
VASPTLVAGSLMTIAEGIGYLSVGFFLRRRDVSESARVALFLFALWWYTIGLNKALAGTIGLGAALGAVPLELYVAVLHLNIAILCISLASLLYYFVYLFWGWRQAILPISAFYVAFYVLLMYNLVRAAPSAIELGQWRTDYVASNTTPPWMGLLIVLMLVLPQAFGALSHFVLYFRTKDPVQRHRIALVSWSIVAWTVSIALIVTPRFNTNAILQLLSRLIGVAAAVAGLMAYRSYPNGAK